MKIFPYIPGLSSTSLTEAERTFFQQYPPTGFILFARNMHSVMQIKALTASLKKMTGRTNLPILIDEEGGHVSRLRHIHDHMDTDFRTAEPGHLKNTDECSKHYRRIGLWLKDMGISVNCAPVLDVRSPSTASFLRARCFSDKPEQVGSMGQVAIQAMLDVGIIPVIKHLPGHGHASLDSHYDLPTLLDYDVDHAVPFQINVHSPWAMTSHLVFQDRDSQPVTFSHKILQDLIRTHIGFQGFLITDDLDMKALQHYSLQERAVRALAAGHDAVLTGQSSLEDLEKMLQSLRPLSKSHYERLEASMKLSSSESPEGDAE